MEIRTKKAGREFEALLFDFIFVDHRCDVKAPRRADDGFSIFSHDRSSRMNSPCGNLNDMGRQTSIHLFCPCNCPPLHFSKYLFNRVYNNYQSHLYITHPGINSVSFSYSYYPLGFILVSLDRGQGSCVIFQAVD
jgi:hypothetical protein